jgi:hypothetical protein
VVNVIRVLPSSGVLCRIILAVLSHIFDILSHVYRLLVLAVWFVFKVELKVDECRKERKR